MTVVIGQFVQQIKDSYKDDNKISELIQQLQLNPNGRPGYVYKDGLLYRKGNVIVGRDAELRKELLKLHHDSALGGIQVSLLLCTG